MRAATCITAASGSRLGGFPLPVQVVALVGEAEPGNELDALAALEAGRA